MPYPPPARPRAPRSLRATVTALVALALPVSARAQEAAAPAAPEPAPPSAPLTLAVPPPAPTSAPATAASPFHFGGYGRVVGASDLEGGRGRPASVVPWGPRTAEGNYLELDFAYDAYRAPADDGVEVDTTVTLAIGEPFFHDSADFDVSAAIRQAMLEARNVGFAGSFVWAGSRMYRGDDLYLFDFWPLDDLHTLGGGLGYRGPSTTLGLHVGVNRPNDPFNVQRVNVPDISFGAAEAEVMDRQRTIASLQGEQRFGGGDEFGLKVKLHLEFHHLPSGHEKLEGSFSKSTPLPDDRGWLAGAEVGLWNFGRNAFANLFLRYASGLAAYGTWEQPYGLNADRRGVDAQELRAAISGNYETQHFGVLYGGWVRGFFDADRETKDFDDRIEAAVSARPMLFVGRYFTPAIEISEQISHRNGLNPRTLTQAQARVTQVALMPALTFGDDPVGTLTRPQLRLIYAVSLLNDAALAMYPEEDPRAGQDVVHFLGLGAEWWYGRGGGR